jgi:hypothetical protein
MTCGKAHCGVLRDGVVQMDYAKYHWRSARDFDRNSRRCPDLHDLPVCHKSQPLLVSQTLSPYAHRKDRQVKDIVTRMGTEGAHSRLSVELLQPCAAVARVPSLSGLVRADGADWRRAIVDSRLWSCHAVETNTWRIGWQRWHHSGL